MNAREDDATRYLVPALERGLHILQLFDRQRIEIAAPDIARELSLPRSTVFRLLQTLEYLHCVERTESGAYRLGTGVLRLGFEYLASLEVTDVARPVVERLRDETTCSAQLVIRDGQDVVVVLKAAGAGTFASHVSVGTRLPCHATILGRTLLSGLTDAELARVYPEPRLPEVASPRAPRTLNDLKKLLREDHARGYAVSESFFEQGISAVAAPVRDYSGDVIAAVSLTVQKPNLDPKEYRERLVQQVLAAAADISQRLNYRPAAAA
jgi:DNA-binding IclR family transcriptional regulator